MASPPGNQQQFTATAEHGDGTQFCPLNNVMSAVMWASSDSLNVSLVADNDNSSVVATCVGATTGTVTITASQYAGGLSGKGTASFTCR